MVLLVRHGRASFGIGDYDRLSDDGRAQAAATGAALAARGVRIDRVLSGALTRQRETARLLAGAAGAPAPELDADWDEYDHLPVLVRAEPRWRRRWLMTAELALRRDRGRHLQAVLERGLAAWVADGGPAGEGGEPFDAFTRRAGVALARAAAQPGTTLVVSSAGTIAAAVAPLIGAAPQSWPHLQRVMVNASITKVVAGRSGVSLVSFNEHGHLEGAAGVKISYR